MKYSMSMMNTVQKQKIMSNVVGSLKNQWVFFFPRIKYNLINERRLTGMFGIHV